MQGPVRLNRTDCNVMDLQLRGRGILGSLTQRQTSVWSKLGWSTVSSLNVEA
jgi:hypothetical protein